MEEYIAEESERRSQLGIVSSVNKNSTGESDNNTCRIDICSDNGDDSGAQWNEIEDEIEGKDDDKEEERGDTESDSGDEDYMPDYLKPKEKLQWDCETIISTYSNLDNHPVQLVSPATGPRDKISSSIANDSGRQEPKRITLSQKSGLPLGVLPTKQSSAGAEGTISRENKGAARNKKETREEKKIRKMQVKEERQEKRKTKSQLKMAFKNDELEEQKRVAHQKLGGVSTFKI